MKMEILDEVGFFAVYSNAHHTGRVFNGKINFYRIKLIFGSSEIFVLRKGLQ
jgi:hypothetical protein